MSNSSTGPTIPTDNERYCIRCYARLSTSRNRCPSCNWPYYPDEASSFLRKPPTSMRKSIAVAMAISIVFGVISYATILSWSQELGLALFFTIPFCTGVFLGCLIRGLNKLLVVVTCAAVVGAIAWILYQLSYSGLFCMSMLILIFMIPTVLGFIAGGVVLLLFGKWGGLYSQPLFAVIAIAPFVHGYIDTQVLRDQAVTTVTTSMTIDADIETVWQNIVFYEELAPSRTFLLNFGLPKPVRVEGNRWDVGNEATCVYERGYVVKKMTAVERPRQLAFDVIEQSVHFERDVSLVDGSFSLTSLALGKTDVVLRTRFTSHLHPVWLWSASERAVVRTLHKHVLEGIALRCAVVQGPQT